MKWFRKNNLDEMQELKLLKIETAGRSYRLRHNLPACGRNGVRRTLRLLRSLSQEEKAARKRSL